MNASLQSEALALTRVDQKRLERLAEMAGRSSRSLLKFVLRDGFEAVEQDIRETLAAELDVARHGSVPHADVMRSTQAIIDTAFARKSKKAA